MTNIQREQLLKDCHWMVSTIALIREDLNEVSGI